MLPLMGGATKHCGYFRNLPVLSGHSNLHCSHMQKMSLISDPLKVLTDYGIRFEIYDPSTSSGFLYS